MTLPACVARRTSLQTLQLLSMGRLAELQEGPYQQGLRTLDLTAVFKVQR